MKRVTAILFALMIGFTYCPLGTAVFAADNEEQPAEIEKSSGNPAKDKGETEEEKESAEKEESFADAKEDKEEEENKKQTGTDKEEDLSGQKIENGSDDSKKKELESSGLENLQFPQKLDVVIDPWEMDGKEQVYSEIYKIRNTGETSGILTFSQLACRPGEDSGVVIRSNKEGLHDGEDKAIYIEMLLGDGEKIIFSEETSQYETEIKAGEELSLRFSGEVNENAFREWEDSDVTVSVVYSWDTEKAESDTDKEETDAGETEKEIKDSFSMEESDEKAEDDSRIEKLMKNSKDEIKNIELSEPQDVEISVNSWKADEEGRISSGQYMLRNTGEIPGTIVLSNFICKSGAQSEIIVQTEKEKLHEDERKAVCMELIVKKDGEIVLPQEGQEDISYEITLNPGEEISVCFAGEINGIDSESLQEGDISVTVLCFWTPEEALSE